MGCGYPEGATGVNIARQTALRAGLPVTVAGVTVNRFCSSGLQAIAMAAQRRDRGRRAGDGRRRRRVDLVRAAALEPAHAPRGLAPREQARALHVDAGDRGERRQALRASRARSRTSTACAASSAPRRPRRRARRKDEIVPFTTTMGVADKDSGRLFSKEVTLDSDEGIRADTTLEGVAKIKSAMPGGVVAAGNASQFSDGASACVVMEAKLAEKRGLQPLGIFRGFAVAGCEPDEMGIGPVFAVPRLLERAGLKVERHRPVGAERGLRRAGDLLPRPARHSRRAPERERRLHRGRATPSA